VQDSSESAGGGLFEI